MIMVTYPPAARGRGLAAPRAIRRFGAAVMEARAMDRGNAPKPPAPVARPPAQITVLPPAEHRTVVRLWLPATLIFLMLAPFALLLAPFLYWVPQYAARPFATVLGLGRVLLSLGGTCVDVDTPEARVLIRLF